MKKHLLLILLGFGFISCDGQKNTSDELIVSATDEGPIIAAFKGGIEPGIPCGPDDLLQSNDYQDEWNYLLCTTMSGNSFYAHVSECKMLFPKSGIQIEEIMPYIYKETYTTYLGDSPISLRVYTEKGMPFNFLYNSDTKDIIETNIDYEEAHTTYMCELIPDELYDLFKIYDN